MTCAVARVAVENAVYHFDKEFSYLIPPSVQRDLTGCRVIVPFGRGNKRRQGIVSAVGIEDTHRFERDRRLLVDDEPVLIAEQLGMCAFMKDHYFCAYYDAVKAMLPAGINYRLSVDYSVSSELGDRFYDLSDEWRRIVSIIRSKNNNIEKNALLAGAWAHDASSYWIRWKRKAFCSRTTRHCAVSVTRRSR